MVDLSCNEAVVALTQTLHDVGLQTIVSFDSRTMRMEKTAVIPPCPHHPDIACDCHMIILLVYDGQSKPITLLAHGQNGKAWITIARQAGQPQAALEKRINRAIAANRQLTVNNPSKRMPNQMTTMTQNRAAAITLNKILYRMSRHWLPLVSLMLFIFMALPWLAPLFMEMGWTRAGNIIYMIYSVQCHQMPQRSFFLFGDKMMYSLPKIQSVWMDTVNPLELRRYVGDSVMGWKVAWSDRMVYMYGSILLFTAVLFLPLRNRLKSPPLPIFFLLLLPMAIDGISHFISDLAGGIGDGFRYHNVWLANLTNDTFPATFYAGDALGSFNSWMRLISGLCFGLAVVWFLYPHIQAGFADTTRQIELKFKHKELEL